MTDTVIEKAAAVAPDLQTKAVELIDQLTAGLKAVAPQMADVTLAAIRMQAIIQLASAIIWMAVTLSALIAGAMFVRRGLSLSKLHNGQPTEKQYEDRVSTYVHGGAAAIAVGFVLSMSQLMSLTATWTWVAIIDPRLALALRVINKLM